MKKYFATTIMVTVLFAVSITSCKKDVPGINSVDKPGSDNISMTPTHFIIRIDTSATKKP